jgi:autotransporter translocation and assembly factor TamB
MLQGIKNYAVKNPGIAIGSAVAALGGLAALAYGMRPQDSVTAQQEVGRTNANTQFSAKMALADSVYGRPLDDMEALQAAAGLAKDLYKFPDRKEKTVRDLEIEGQLAALQAQALQQKYLR